MVMRINESIRNVKKCRRNLREGFTKREMQDFSKYASLEDMLKLGTEYLDVLKEYLDNLDIVTDGVYDPSLMTVEETWAFDDFSKIVYSIVDDYLPD